MELHRNDEFWIYLEGQSNPLFPLRERREEAGLDEEE
jgi:hypothetical protein